MHHSPYNFSLMPMTGGMNNRKKFDRPDWLFCAIEKFYENMKKNEFCSYQESDINKRVYELQTFGYKFITQRKKSINHIVLYEFLLYLKSFEAYVENFYNFDLSIEKDKTLLAKITGFASNQIMSATELEKYMDLAIEYWDFQKTN